jgi:serine/threonine protein phosphatase PrpC
MFALGMASEIQQKAFADKKTQKSGSAEDFKIGYACKKGLKPESPNQDDFCIFVTDTISIFGVFDGHGPYGHDISNFCHERLPESVVKDEKFKDDPAQALSDAFPATHRSCIDAAQRDGFDCALSGTTATLAMLKQSSLYVANVGDSRAVLAIDRGGQLKAVDLTQDHKPDCEAEARRIIASGKGQVRRLEGDIPKRVFLKDKMYPGLAMTRSIGDTVGVDAGVICTPDVTCQKMEQDWLLLLVCSDGVWEFITSQEAVDIVSRFQPSECQKAAEALASEAWNRWVKEEVNVVDDITVIINWFNEK